MSHYIMEYALSRVRGYCKSLGLDRLETARCTTNASTLIRNGNTKDMAVAHAIALAERIKAKQEQAKAERGLYRPELGCAA